MAAVIKFKYQIPTRMILTVKNISKSFELENERILALKDISFDVETGEFLTIIGPSGCGKSTLLRIIAGLIKSTHGEIIWQENPRLGFVFQSFALFPFLTVFDNIDFGLKMKGIKIEERKEIVQELINEVGLSGFENKHPKELSGGMKQRVGIARSLVVNPNVLLLDEPFSALDEFTAQTLRKLLLDIWVKRKITIIQVTHLISEAIELANKIIVLSPAPGRIEKTLINRLSRPRAMRSPEFYALEDELNKLIWQATS